MSIKCERRTEASKVGVGDWFVKKYAQNMDSVFADYQTHSQGVATLHQPTPVTRTNFIMEDLSMELINHFLIAMEPTTSGPQDKINHGKAMGGINNFLVADDEGVNPQKPKECISSAGTRSFSRK